jgi:hypothetical protein
MTVSLYGTRRTSGALASPACVRGRTIAAASRVARTLSNAVGIGRRELRLAEWIAGRTSVSLSLYLRACPKSRVGASGELVYPCRHDKDVLPDRPDGRAMDHRWLVGAPAKTWRTACQVYAPGNRERDTLSGSQRRRVAWLAARPATVPHRIPLLPVLAKGWDPGPHSRPVADPRPPT